MIKVNVGGLFRCCLESIPKDEYGNVLSGKENEHIPCKYCKDKEKSGVVFVNGVWQACEAKYEY